MPRVFGGLFASGHCLGDVSRLFAHHLALVKGQHSVGEYCPQLVLQRVRLVLYPTIELGP
ncbi:MULTISPECIES: hypothetical protein [unclassified Paraburkholderia]|uniref:hypothetical protein n=1 Tax=unclassified Paraburkholderia TaxID=2615204 RepID=UPI0016196E6D|nr:MULTISPECIES: hypothetical protein [unclassified Paraburkholderia]MBB5446832.1 hypothetical protein [Paraburkholderia sp. WSM4177]MBB5487299.1 hypothetical protein [Paraburkholderia sp. WSM4180]